MTQPQHKTQPLWWIGLGNPLVRILLSIRVV